MPTAQLKSDTQLPILEARTRWFVSMSLFLWMALDLSFRLYVSVDHAYQGFVYQPDWLKYAEGLGIYMVLLAVSPKFLKRPSDLYQIILLFGLLLPVLLLYGLVNHEREYLYIMLMGYLLIDWLRRGSVIGFPVLRQGKKVALTGLVVGSILVSVWLLASGGVRHFNLDLTAVYEFRGAVGSVVNQGVMTYLNSWAYNVFGPTLLAIALWKRHFGLALLVFAAHVYWFGVSSHKAVLFYPFLVLSLWYWFRKTNALSIIPIGITAVVLISLLLYKTTDFGISVSTLFIRRVFFVPSNIAFTYYEFFSANELVYWSNSVLSCCLDYPYNLHPDDVIGEWMGAGSGANNSFLANGFMHAGVWGVAGYSITIGLIFRLIDSLARQGLPLWLATAVLIVPMRSLLLSADLPTSLLTHGIGVGLLVLFLLRSSDSSKQQKRTGRDVHEVHESKLSYRRQE